MNDIHQLLQFPSRRSRSEDGMTRLDSAFTFPGASNEPTSLVWQCSVCGPVFPMHLPNGLWVKRRACDCKRQEREARELEAMRQAWMANQVYRTFGGWLGEAWVDTSLTTRTFTTFQRKRNPKAYVMASRFADAMHGNLIFYGEYGIGKTHLAAAICNAVRERRVTSLFTTAPKFFMAYNDRMKHDADCHALIKQAISTPLLVIDDVDKSHPTDARQDTYFLILDERCKAQRPTIITTNSMDELHIYIGKACRSRLMTGLQAVEMLGDDYRLEQSPHP